MAPPIKDVSVADFADLLGVTSARVYQHIQAGMPHRLRGKRTTRIVPREAIAWLIDRAKEFAAPKDGGNSARNRRELAEAELKELDVLERRHALVPIEEFESFTAAVVGALASVASGQLQRFEREIVTADTPAAARKVTEQIHVALMAGTQEYADHLEQEATAMEAALREPAPASDGAAA